MIRRARPDDAAFLANLAMRSTAVWGYESKAMAAFPNAAEFHVACGARRIGSVPSTSVPGRQLPLFELSA